QDTTTCRTVPTSHGQTQVECYSFPDPNTQGQQRDPGVDIFGSIRRGQQQAREDLRQEQLHRQQLELERLRALEYQRRLQQQSMQQPSLQQNEIAPGIFRDPQGGIWYIASNTGRSPHQVRADVAVCNYKTTATGQNFSINRWTDDPCPP